MHVAREAWQCEGRSPGCAFRGLWLLVDSIQDERDDRKTKRSSVAPNLLDPPHTGGMERRIAQSSRDILGTNPPHALKLLHAHADVRRFAVRHALIDAAFAAKSEANVAMLKRKIGFAV